MIAAVDAGEDAALVASPLNARTLADVTAIRRRLVATGNFVSDLQFLIAADGALIVNDSDAPVRRAVLRDDLRQLEGIEFAARRAIELRTAPATAGSR